MELKAIIVEDEKHSQETLRNMLTEFCDGVHIAGMAGTVDEAVALIRKESPDLVFLDIELKSGTGFDVLERVGDMHFKVVFTTAYEHYALRAIKVSSVDYLLKPIDLDELIAAVDKVRSARQEENNRDQWQLLLQSLKGEDYSKRICLSTADGMEFIQTADIVLCEASGSYTKFILRKGASLLVSKHLKEYENMLNPREFMRVHNSYLINLKEVRKFVRSEGGYILMNNDRQVPISPKKREEFIEKMGTL